MRLRMRISNLNRVRLAVFRCTHALNKDAWGVSKIQRKNLAWARGETPWQRNCERHSLAQFLAHVLYSLFLSALLSWSHLRLDDSGVCVLCLWCVTHLQVNRYVVFNYVILHPNPLQPFIIFMPPFPRLILHPKPITKSKAPPELLAELRYPRNTSAERPP